MQIVYQDEMLKELFSSYRDKYADLEHSISPKAIRKKYGTGGIIHRAYYCPSQIIDIVIGGAKRGRMSNDPSREERSKTVFFFDSDNRLTQVDEFGFFPERVLCRREFLWYQDNYTMACTYNMNLAALPKICQASICQYDPDGKILQYQTMLSGTFLEGDPLRSFSIQAEEYYYDPKSQLLEKVLRGRWLVYETTALDDLFQAYQISGTQGQIESSCLYRFQHNDEGRVITYTVQELSPKKEDKPHFAGQIPKSKQRKI